MSLSDLWNVVLNNFSNEVVEYIEFISGVIVGIIGIAIYNRIIGLRTLKNNYERIISDKEQYISDLKMIVCDRLGNIEVGKYDRSLINRIKKYFRIDSMKGKR